MNCPKCGAVMNHHADKLIDPQNAEDVDRVDPIVGGVIEQIHGCPNCGNVASRREERHG
jgi:ribosomal protein S27AE